MKKTFNTAMELAKWIKENIHSSLEQERLMYCGVRHKQVAGTYTIYL